ncbi:MAG: SDR family oxidoreductase [Archaeoglobaceae archaeon]
MMDKRIAVVTGANKGIGLEIVKQLAEKGITAVLTSRDEIKGKKASEDLKKHGLDVLYHQLDVTDDLSIKRLADYVEHELGKLDILVNNAGINIDENKNTLNVDMGTVRKTMETNFYGPFRVSQALLPLLLKSDDARIINISSGLGALSSPISEHHPFPVYSISKTALNALTVNMASDLRNTNVKVNSACPGWVRTDMGGPHAHKSPQEGADTAVWLATTPNIPSGKFFRERKEIEW